MKRLLPLLCLLFWWGPLAAKPTVLVVGDSLSAAYGLSVEDGWVALLERELAPRGIKVANASISGETTAGGASRIDAELARTSPSVVVVALGANDGLRGLPLAEMRANLARIVVASKARGARVLLVGIRIPPNYGADYADAFHATYAALAREHGVALLPFLLEPIASGRDGFLPDQLHPNAAAQPKLLAHVLGALEPLLAVR
ncbi:MAG TPA: arylesterase [Candidatus Saccharimonadia bacterium]|nr:arylesterase [Candidatus Saccharimonadia bacterium]